MNEVVKNLCERRSVRKFNNKQVPRNTLEEILKCGTYAPNGRGVQAPVIVAIQNKEDIQKIGEINGSFFKPGIDPFYGAPTLIVVFADKTKFTYINDGSAALTNIVNAAYSLGVDSCWIHRAKETFETEVGKEYMKKWGLDDNYEGIGNVILGYKEGALPNPAPRKENYIIYND